MNTILVAEDEPEVRNYLGLALTGEGYSVEYAQNGQEVLQCLASGSANVSLLLLDLFMPIKNGLETLEEVRREWPSLPVIILSESCTAASVATVLKRGARDVLSKPVGHDDLLRAIRAALPPASSQAVVSGRTDTLGDHLGGTGSAILPSSTWSQRAEVLMKQVGASDVPVLMRGEIGVGKEVFARKLHEHSRRAGRPFLKLNCAALSSELIESELFGYEKGAVTGSLKNASGKFEMAHTGTIFLDEIGDVDFKLQARLLQVLQDLEFLRLGAKDPSRADVRVIAATHCNLERAIGERRFREDLYYRLNMVEIYVPPLRERREEIISLAQFFLHKYSVVEAPELPSSLRRAMMEYHWPGNVRELENVMRKYLVFRNAELIANDLQRKRQAQARVCAPVHSASITPRKITPIPISDRLQSVPMNYEGSPKISGKPDVTIELHVKAVELKRGASLPNSTFEAPLQNQPENPSVLATADRARRQAEPQAIVAALNATLWNRKQAALLLDIDYEVLLYKMKKLGINSKWAGATSAGNGIE